MEKNDIEKYVQFIDWLDEREFEDKNWIVVAKTLKCKDGPFDEDYFTFSVLVQTITDSAYANLLSTPDCWPSPDFGHPIVWDNTHGKIQFDLGESKEIEGILYKPFTIRRCFDSIQPARFEIIQNFVLFHNLYFVAEESVYRKIGGSGEEVDVIALHKDITSEEIKVKTNYLRDYLYFYQMALLRQHDHKRWFYDASPITNKEGSPFPLKEKGKLFYSLNITNKDYSQERKCLSHLYGKDIVKAFSKPDYSLHDLYFDKKYEKFIIGLDDDGNTTEETCNKDELSNYFKNRGKPDSLTPVFFKREVLKYYNDNPKRFTDDGIEVRCLNQWSIVYNTNKNNLVQVWLGDLGRIPYEAQKHWRQFNVPPEGGITKETFQRDFLAEFVDSPDPVYKFKQVYELAQSNFRTQFGFGLHNKLTQKDSHCYLTLHIPVTDEQKEFDEQVQYFAKIIIDPINKVEIDKKISIQSALPIESLRTFLTEVTNCQDDNINIIIDTYKLIQSIRSSGSAHLKGSKYEKEIRCSSHELC